MSAMASDLVNFQEDIKFQVSDSPKHIAAVLSSQQKGSGHPAHSKVRFFVVVLDVKDRVLLPNQPNTDSLKTSEDRQLSVLDLPGVDLSLLDTPELGVNATTDPDASVNAWTFAVVTAEMGNNTVYGELQILYAAGTAPPDDVSNEQAVVIVVACCIRGDFHRVSAPCTPVSGIFGMDWSELHLGDSGVKAVFWRLEHFITLKNSRHPDKSDVRITFEGRSYFIRRSASSMLAIEAEPFDGMSSYRPSSLSLPAISLKIQGRRYVHRKHFARSKPATEYREQLLKREQMRNGKRRSAEFHAKRWVIEGLRDAVKEAGGGGSEGDEDDGEEADDEGDSGDEADGEESAFDEVE